MRGTDRFISDDEAESLRQFLLSRRTALGMGVAAIGLSVLAPRSGVAQGSDPSGAAITVDQARSAPIPIGIPSFGPGLGAQISEVIAADLGNTGLFKVLASSPGAPDFEMLKSQGARAAVSGNVLGNGDVQVEMRLWDVLTGGQIQGTRYSANRANWRRIAHIIADVIYERLVGEKGYFDTRIAYISRTGPGRQLTTRLAIMDQDGENAHILTQGRWLTLTPRFDPRQDRLAFMSYANNRPRVYLFDIKSAQQRLLGEFHGISFAPRFSPDGHQVVLSATRAGGSDIWVVDLASGVKRQITSSGAIDTSPCFSPDGTQIVFNSDRGGSPQLYIMSASGGSARRISYGQGSYGSPVWSPRGDVIAFSRIANGSFSLGVIGPDGGGERILTEGFTVESPTFCPNGRVLAYCRQTRAGHRGAGFSTMIDTIDITGFHGRTIPTRTGASDPAWSPYNG